MKNKLIKLLGGYTKAEVSHQAKKAREKAKRYKARLEKAQYELKKKEAFRLLAKGMKTTKPVTRKKVV